MNRVTRIFDYVMFLKENYNLNISFHTVAYENLISGSKLLLLNSHDNPYCVHIKSNTDALTHCLECQKKVAKKCNNGSFVGTCYAGVKEYVYPINNNQKIVGFISVSGYKDDNYISYINKISNDYYFNKNYLISIYDSLFDNLPKKELIDMLIYPLCDMLELSYHYSNGNNDDNINNKILNYINLNHRNKITLEELSKKFFISSSTISHNFKKDNGISINDYINKLRVNDAKHLLKTTNLTVTEIGFMIGFNGLNYFINVFTKYEGVSPLKYRTLTKYPND